MCREQQPKVTPIKELNYLNNLDITKLFRKLSKHDNELKRFSARKVISKKKVKVKEEKRDISLKASSLKTKKVKDVSNNYKEESSK